jgi:hypothetical protein
VCAEASSILRVLAGRRKGSSVRKLNLLFPSPFLIILFPIMPSLQLTSHQNVQWIRTGSSQIRSVFSRNTSNCIALLHVFAIVSCVRCRCPLKFSVTDYVAQRGRMVRGRRCCAWKMSDVHYGGDWMAGNSVGLEAAKMKACPILNWTPIYWLSSQ